MNADAVSSSLARRVVAKVPLYLSSIRIWESLFALPFAYIGMVLAADGWPGWDAFIWINVAMFGARTLAMSGNRVINAREDALNPAPSTATCPRVS